MEFNKFPTAYSVAKSIGRTGDLNPQGWYRYMLENLSEAEVGKFYDGRDLLRIEYLWYEFKKPYYNLWPVVIEAFAETSLEINCSVIFEKFSMMPSSFTIRLPIGKELAHKGLVVKSILCGHVILNGKSGKEFGIGVWVDYGEFGVTDYTLIALDPEKTVEEALRESQNNYNPEGLSEDDRELLEKALRIICCIMMIHDNEELVERIVLNRDKEKYENTKDEALVERAIRNGENGWNVGKHVEVAPHYRRPHFGIRWTGIGRTIPKLVPIKGAVIHKKMIVEVPSGYEDTFTKN